MDFEDVELLLAGIGTGINGNPAEIHGRLCGRISGGQTPASIATALPALAAELLAEGSPALPALTASLRQLHDQCQRKLRDADFGFVPLLPDDDLPLAQRIEALASWCQGFLSGLGQSGLRGDTRLSAEVTDALRDLAAIALADADVTDDDAGEAAYMELVEYVRVAALAIFGELGADSDAGSPAQPEYRVH